MPQPGSLPAHALHCSTHLLAQCRHLLPQGQHFCRGGSSSAALAATQREAAGSDDAGGRCGSQQLAAQQGRGAGLPAALAIGVVPVEGSMAGGVSEDITLTTRPVWQPPHQRASHAAGSSHATSSSHPPFQIQQPLVGSRGKRVAGSAAAARALHRGGQRGGHAAQPARLGQAGGRSAGIQGLWKGQEE